MRGTIATIAVMLALCACNTGVSVDGEDAGPPGIAAQGMGTTRTFAVDGFTAVDLRGSDNVDVRVGPGFSVRADGDTKLLDQLKIWKSGTTLHIGRIARSGISIGGGDIRIAVTLPALAAASIAGSGDLRIDRVQGASFTGQSAGSGNLAVAAVQVDSADVSLAGSGDVSLAGTAKQLKVTLAGSGDVEAGGLTANAATVSVAGSGNVKAIVDGPAKVSVMGSGNVSLGSKARCESSKMGSGTIDCG